MAEPAGFAGVYDDWEVAFTTLLNTIVRLAGRGFGEIDVFARAYSQKVADFLDKNMR
ncbi:hypothetical protein [Rhodoblastus sp.]|uniref:hypothetical protein n=1 Tax=Rhodoblastus sp. TaxID=1962975 RepID=UPI003F9580BE